jgi:Collagen triple helix repeat (20 copies)
MGAICIIGLGVATPQPASSATCLRTATPLTAAIATGPIPISMGLKFFPVSNQSPFVTGMRIRVVVGRNTKTTRFVEGRVGSISNCNIALLVDRISGTGTMLNARFAVAGEIGAQGPAGTAGITGATGPSGAQGIQGPQGIQGIPGTNGFNGANGQNGINGLVPAYGSFRDTTTQQIDAVNTPKAMTFNQITPGVNGVSASGVSVEFGSHIVVARTGTYNIQFSAQLTKTDSGNDIMDIWLRRNGSDVPLSNSEITITASLRQVATSNYIIDLAAGDYVQLMYSSADIATRILAIAPQTNPVRPAGPSIAVAITQVQ